MSAAVNELQQGLAKETVVIIIENELIQDRKSFREKHYAI